jgi:hypothetical protein
MAEQDLNDADVWALRLILGQLRDYRVPVEIVEDYGHLFTVAVLLSFTAANGMTRLWGGDRAAAAAEFAKKQHLTASMSTEETVAMATDAENFVRTLYDVGTAPRSVAPDKVQAMLEYADRMVAVAFEDGCPAQKKGRFDPVLDAIQDDDLLRQVVVGLAGINAEIITRGSDSRAVAARGLEKQIRERLKHGPR